MTEQLPDTTPGKCTSGDKLTGEDVQRLIQKNRGSIGLDLSGLNLAEANLKGLDLRGVKLRNANLRQACLNEANLAQADLRGANLEGANLRECCLNYARLNKANLRGAELQRASLVNADLRCANLQGADLWKAKLGHADLWQVNLRHAYLIETDLTNANLREVNLESTDLKLTNFQYARLEFANLRGADLWSANLSSANLFGAILCSARLTGANLRGALLHTADLRGADLTGADLREASLYQARLDRTIIVKESLGTKIIEEMNGYFYRAKEVYLSLKNNFRSIGRNEDASWAHIKEQRMLRATLWPLRAKQYYGEGLWGQKAFLSKRWWWFYLKHGFQWLCSLIFDLSCGYGELPWRTLICSACIVTIFALIFAMTGWIKVDSQRADLGASLLFSLGAFTTLGLEGFKVACWGAQLLAALEAIIGVSLLALFMFALGNRLSRF